METPKINYWPIRFVGLIGAALMLFVIYYFPYDFLMEAMRHFAPR
jgi:hypothetical protein